MRITNILKNEIEACEQDHFKKSLIFDNMQRGKILAVAVIIYEVLLNIANLSSYLLNVDNRFQYAQYFVMYTLLIIINVLFLIFCNKNEKLDRMSLEKLKIIETVITVYVTFLLCWGSVVSLMDQALYGQLIAYMLNLSICSVVYYLDNRTILIPYSISALILLVGLPFFQGSQDILIGHYVNLAIFIFTLWLTSRILYHGYCNHYNSMVQLKNSKLQLENEIAKNRSINHKLSIANRQLKELTLMDELTGIPNRRSFKHFINRMMYMKHEEKNLFLSVMMIDIDYFKQYNDHYGHDEGDKALIAVANQILSTIRNPLEFAVRWGGEEFLFAGVYDTVERPIQVAEEIRRSVSELKIPHLFSEAKNVITISIGICTTQLKNKENIIKALELADKALYLAKDSGRNGVKELSLSAFSDGNTVS